jgi:hypothetical protein
MLRRLFQWLQFPGLVQSGQYSSSGVFLNIVMSQNYTTIRVNNLDFYFNRESGKYDGWGYEQGVRDATA